MAPQAFQAAKKFLRRAGQDQPAATRKHQERGWEWSRPLRRRPLRIRIRLHRSRIPPAAKAGLFPAPHRLRTRRRSVRF